MQLFVAMIGCAGEGGRNVLINCMSPCSRYDCVTMHAGLVGAWGGWGWVGGMSPSSGVHAADMTALRCLLGWWVLGVGGGGWAECCCFEIMQFARHDRLVRVDAHVGISLGQAE